LAIIEGLRCHPRLSVTEIAYVGTRRGLEAHLLVSRPWIKFFPIRARGFDRAHWGRLALALIDLPLGLLQSLWILLTFRPQVIIGVGGYAAFAPLFWGVLLRIPTVIHEQNIKPGLVNRLLARRVNKICLTYAETKRYFSKRVATEKMVVTGLPVRPSVLTAKPDHERFGLQAERPTIFVVGGSRGSEFLTRIILNTYPKLKNAQVLLVTGSQGAATETAGSFPAHEGLVRIPYIEDIGSALALADLVICRAGATTLAELAAAGKPAILVPWPGAAENHQLENAQALANSGACLLAPESELDADRLAQLIHQLLDDRRTLAKMKSRMSELGRKTALDHILREVEVLVHA
jgi:UDP-N-acetylglucosamine--N-acetylmuramyl-(pentapeptide) pyrophosphoryl-undecaprenol N-acetylglucosamine transferase